MADGGISVFRFRLYIASGERSSTLAVENLNALCRAHFPGSHEIELVDVLREPGRALEAGISLIPTLIKFEPAPLQQIVGSLNVPAEVLNILAGAVSIEGNASPLLSSSVVSDKIQALIVQLHAAEQKLDNLTLGEVDAVIGLQGLPFFPLRSEERMRRRDAVPQRNILDALSKHIALLDARGIIVSVNEAWRQFAASNAFHGSAYGVGIDYLDLCDRAAATVLDDPDIVDAQRAATGIRSVLAGSSDQFTMEYPCHSPSEQRWFRMTVHPLSKDRRDGAVVLHDNVSERERAILEKRQSAELLRAVIDGTTDHVFVKDLEGRYLLCNAALARSIGRTAEQVIGMDDTAVFGIEAAHPLIESDRRVIDSGSSFTGEYSLSGTAGFGDYHVSKTPYLDAHGKVKGVVGISRDITSRKQAEDELRRSKSLLSMAGRLARFGAWSLDLSHGYIFWSDEICAIHGVPAGTSPSYEEALTFYVPECITSIRDAIQDCILHGKTFDLELEIVTALSARIWVRVVGEAVRGSDVAITGIQGAFQDLSERKESEEEARRLARRLLNSLESITDAFVILDRQWRITYVNGQAERLLSRSRDQMLGRVVWDALPSLRSSDFERGYRRAMDEGVVVTVESYDAEFDAWFRATAYPSEEGLAVDIRRTSEERAARRHLELLEASVSQLQDIVLITDAAPPGDPGPRICFVNAEFTRVTGYESEEVNGQPPRLLWGAESDRTEIKRIEGALSRTEPVHAEVLSYRRDGVSRWIEMDVVPVAVDRERVSHFVMTGRDITARRHDQEALRELHMELESRVLARTAELDLARREAEEANRAKSIFLATMSHEIRTPLNGVVGMIDVLHQSSLQPYQVDMVRLIRESAESLGAIIDDILDFSKIEAGKLTLECTPLQPGELVENVCSMLAPVAAKRDVRLEVFIDPNIPDSILGDQTRLRQVLVNLVGNAIKFSGVSGATPGWVSVRALMVERNPRGVTLEATVSDNGIGMNPTTVSQLFTAFTQADASTTRHFGGTGLGLAISRTLINLMGGEIRVRSTLGAGSTFTVRIPFAVVDQAHVDDERALPLRGLQCRIIGNPTQLADDIASTLAHAGVTVARSPDLSSAAAVLQGGRWVWLIMPGQSVPGLPELRAMTADNSTRGSACFIVLQKGPGLVPHPIAPDLVNLGTDALRRRTLIDALRLVAGEPPEVAGRQSGSSASGTAAVSSTTTAPIDHRVILVAEDNETNRAVFLQQISLLGYAAEFAVNGREALERWRDGTFALLLTDIHMPEMDGYALAAAIRREEGGRSRIPIIAATANALRDEELRCRAAGMDDYLTKPIRLARLKALLDSWIGVCTTPPALTEPVATVDPVNLKVLIDLVGNDPLVIGEVLRAFRISAAKSRGDMEQAASIGELHAVSDAAHRLKSGARSIGAPRLGEICEEIEAVGERRDIPRLSVLMPLFQIELSAVLRSLESR